MVKSRDTQNVVGTLVHHSQANKAQQSWSYNIIVELLCTYLYKLYEKLSANIGQSHEIRKLVLALYSLTPKQKKLNNHGHKLQWLSCSAINYSNYSASRLFDTISFSRNSTNSS